MLDVVPFVSVSVCELLEPTVTLPNDSLVGFSSRSPVPSPVRDTVTFGLEASLVTVSVALNGAAAFGVNEIVALAFCPAAIVMGRVGETSAKYLVENEAPVIVSALFPELVALMVRVFVVPGLTCPKSRLAFPRSKFAYCSLEADWLNP